MIIDRHPIAGTLDDFLKSESLAIEEKTVRLISPLAAWIVHTEDGKTYFITARAVDERWPDRDDFQRMLDERRQRLSKRRYWE